jgi:hypothetical protein
MTDWDDLRALVEAIHGSFLEQLMLINPTLWSHSEAWTNDVFPLSTALTLNLTGGDRDEDVLLTARLLNTPDGIDFDSDISREDGQILAQGPTSALASKSLGEQKDWAKANLKSYEDFLSSEVGLISRELRKLNS